MNAATLMYQHRIGTRTLPRAALLLALAAIGSSSACADSPTASRADTLSARVSLAGLDISTPAGARMAYDRLTAAAEHLCAQLSSDHKSAFRETYAECVHETLADAVRKLGAPALVAVAGARNAS